MASPQHLEIEAAKFLQKLIQESKDEPAKLATKLFVICQHMKMSGKEQSLPYQVISRAMETVINQHGLDIDALKSSRLPFSGGASTMVPGDVRMEDRDAPESSMLPGGTNDSSTKTGNVAYGGQSKEISLGVPPNVSIMQDNQTVFAGQREPGNTSIIGMEETRSGSSHEKQDPFGTEKLDIPKGSKDSRKVNTKRKRLDPALTMKEGPQNQISQQNDSANNINLTSKKGKLMTHVQVEDRRTEQLPMTPMQHADRQLSSFSGSKESLFRVTTEPFQGSLPEKSSTIENSFMPHSVGMRQLEEREASSVSGFPASTRGSSVQLRLDGSGSRGLWNQTKVGFPSGIAQGSPIATDSASGRMVEDWALGFSQQPSGVIVNKSTAFRGPKGKESILGNAGAFDSMDQNTLRTKAETSASDTCSESNMHINVGRARGAVSKETSKSPFASQGTPLVDLPFKEQHLRQLRAQCLVFLAFRNGLVPRKLHLEIALGERSTADDGSFKLLNQQTRELPGMGPSQIHEGKESSGMDSSHSHEAGGAPSNSIRETEKDANAVRNIPGSSPSGSLSEMDAASKEIESVRRANSKKSPPDCMVTSDERKRPPSATKKYDYESECQETAESDVKTSVSFAVDWVRPTESTSSQNLPEKRLHQDGNQLLEKYDHIQHSVLVRPKHAEHPLIGSAGSVIPNDTQRSTMSFTSMQKFHPNIAHTSLTQSEAQTATSASGKWEPSSMSLKPPAPIKHFDHESNKQAVESARHNGVLCENELTGNTRVPCPVSSNQIQKHRQPAVPEETFTHEEGAQDGDEEEEEEEEVEFIDMEIDGRPFSPPKHTMLEKWIMDMHKKKVLDEQKWALKQRKAEESMEARITELKEVVSSSNTTSSKTRSVIELKKLRLLHLQRRMKSEFLHDHFKPIASDMDRLKTIKKHRHGRRAKQLERYEMKMREERQKRLRERQKEFFSDLEAHKERLDDFYKARRERWKGFNRFVKEFHKRKDRIHKEKIERIQREKINLLKNNDVEGYLRMVQDAKSERVEQLLKETEKYLQKLGSKLQEAKSVARQFEMEMDDSRAINASDKGDITVQNEDEHDQAKHYLENNEKYYQIAHSVKESISEQPSILKGGKLREYQMNGLRWLVSLYNNHLNGILADEMGLGKTIQVISLICYLMESKNDRGPFLVVVPSSVLPGWVSEITFWAPSITAIVYAGPPEDRRKLFKERIVHQKFNVLLTTYEYLMNKNDRPKLSKILWHYIIIDEDHRIKNAACKLNAELKHYQSSHRLLLTGTPLQNNLEELWALLNFLLPNIFNSAEDFSQWFNKPFENGNDNSPDEALLSEEENLLIINRLHQVLRPFMLRRLKHKVENELPEKIERLIRCEASAYQKLLMKRIEENLGSLGTAKGRSVHNTVMELRNICNHPYLSQLHAEEIDGFLRKHFLPPLVRHCGKLEMLDRLLPKLKATGHRVLCFSTMTRLLDVMEEYLSWKGYKYLRLDGHTSGNERGVLIDEFNKADSAAFIFLLSIRAGGVGVNLQAADTVVIFDTDWNPQVDLQAQARAHRIGQKRDVLVLRLETVRTVEEQVRAAAEHKLGVANQSITAGFFDNNTSAEDRREYLEGLLRECKKEEAAPVLEDDALNYILARSESEIDVFESIDKKRHEDELALWRKILQAQGKDVTEHMPSRLVTEDDLKPFYQAMKIYESSNVTVNQKSEYLSICDTKQYGRGKRTREVRSYEDQWTEEEFEKLCQVDSPESPLPKEPAHDSLKANDLGGSSKPPKEPACDSLKSKDLGGSSKPPKEPAYDSLKSKDLSGSLKPPKEPACDSLKSKNLGGSSKAQGVEEQPPSKRGRGRPKRGSDASLVLGKQLEFICKKETGSQQQHPGAAGSLPSVPVKVPARRTPGSETRQRSLKHSGISSVSGPSLEINQVPGPSGMVLDKSPKIFVSQEKQWLNKPSKTVVSSIGHADSQGAEPRRPADLVSVRVPGITHIEDKNISILPGPINREPMKELVFECKKSVGEVSSKSQECENYVRLVDMNKQDYGGNTLKATGTKSRKESLGQLSGVVIQRNAADNKQYNILIKEEE